jgi:hypothetical protein
LSAILSIAELLKEIAFMFLTPSQTVTQSFRLSGRMARMLRQRLRAEAGILAVIARAAE